MLGHGSRFECIFNMYVVCIHDVPYIFGIFDICPTILVKWNPFPMRVEIVCIVDAEFLDHRYPVVLHLYSSPCSLFLCAYHEYHRLQYRNLSFFWCFRSKRSASSPLTWRVRWLASIDHVIFDVVIINIHALVSIEKTRYYIATDSVYHRYDTHPFVMSGA